MKKTILSLTAAAAVGLAGIAATPQQAHAVVWWVAPAIVAGAVGGVAVGATAANANQYYRGPGDVYVQPTSECRLARVQGNDGRWHRTRICS